MMFFVLSHRIFMHCLFAAAQEEYRNSMLKQLSIFAENQKGAMNRMTGLLSEANVNLQALLTNDSAEFGIVRMLVSDCEKAYEVLENAGYLCHVDKVIGVDIADEKGSLNQLLNTLTAGNINVDYLYMSYDRNAATPIAVIRTADPYEVEELLRGNGYRVL